MRKMNKAQRKFLKELNREGIRYSLKYGWFFSIDPRDITRYKAIEKRLKEEFDL